MARPEAGVHGVEPGDLEAFLDLLEKHGIRVLSLDEVIEIATAGRELEQPAVAFTADDGYVDQAEIIGRVFADRGRPLTIFLITAFLDGEDWPWDAKIAHVFHNTSATKVSLPVGRLKLDFDLSTPARSRLARKEFQLICKSLGDRALAEALEQLAEQLSVTIPESPPREYAPMTWGQARELESRGVRFAPHSRTHRVLSTLTEAEVGDELARSWERISAELARPLKVIAWPFGREHDFGDRELRIAKRLRFDGAVAARDRYTSVVPPVSRFEVDRFGFRPDDHGRTAWQIASGIRSLEEFWLSNWGLRSHPTSPEALAGAVQLSQVPLGRRTRLGSMLYTGAAMAGRYRRPDGGVLRDTRRIIFVCQGNICRSPYAEAVARRLGLPAISCGIRANSVASANPVAARMAFGRGVDLSRHRSVNIRDLELGAGDLLLGMEPRHLDELHRVASGSGAYPSLLGLWASPPRPWIEDPFGRSPETFERAFRLIDESLARLAADLETVPRGSTASA